MKRMNLEKFEKALLKRGLSFGWYTARTGSVYYRISMTPRRGEEYYFGAGAWSYTMTYTPEFDLDCDGKPVPMLEGEWFTVRISDHAPSITSMHEEPDLCFYGSNHKILLFKLFFIFDLPIRKKDLWTDFHSYFEENWEWFYQRNPQKALKIKQKFDLKFLREKIGLEY